MLQTLSRDFHKLYLMVVFVYFTLTRGLMANILRGISLPYFQSFFGVSLQEYHNLYATLLLMPWCLKPVFGAISDYFPINRKRKFYYILVCCALMIAGLAHLCLHSTLKAAQLALLMISCSLVFCDLLFEASYAEQLRDVAEESGTKLVTFAWGCGAFGGAVAAVIAGMLGDAKLYDVAFVIAMLGPIFTAILVLLNSVPEKQARFSWLNIARGLKKIRVAFLIAAFSVVLTLIENSATAVKLSLVVVLPCIIFYNIYWVQPSVVANCNLFLFLTEATNINFVGATDYFYTSKCFGNPNFSYTFYVTYSLLLGSIFTLIGIYIYTKIEHLHVKSIFCWVTVLKVIASGVEVAQVARLNLGYMDDQSVYILGEAVVQPVISMLYFMPMVVLTSRLTSKSTEAITYATMAGLQNMGTLIAAQLGGVLTSLYRVDNCEFTKFPQALVMGHMTTPLLIIPLAFYLLPRYKPSSKT